MAPGRAERGPSVATGAIRALTGPVSEDDLNAIARLRIDVFREYPYLYDGDMAYEQRYLAGLAGDPQALVLIAEADGDVVGCATSLPLLGSADITAAADVAGQFAAAGLDPARCYYYSEILVRPEWRGAGLAKAFYGKRATFAAERGFTHVCFAAVVRPTDDPRRPADYFDPGPLWRRMGFEPRDEMVFHYEWPTLQPDGATADASHPMRFWIKPLPA